MVIHRKIIIILLIICSYYFISSCSDPPPVRKNIISKDDLPTVAIENIKSTYSEEGKTKGKLMAALLLQFDGIVEPYFDFPKGISILLFDKESKIESSLTSKRFIYYQSKNTWEAIGNVVITNINGNVFKTEKLYGDEKQNKIYTDHYVKVTQADGTVINGGKGFESNTSFSIYKFIDVDGRLTYEDDFTDASADSLSTNKK